MKIEKHAPVARGVDKLMYVGDVPSPMTISPLWIGVAILAGWMMFRGK